MTITENTVYLLLSALFLFPALLVKPEAFWGLHPAVRFLITTSFLTGFGLAGTVLIRGT